MLGSRPTYLDGDAHINTSTVKTPGRTLKGRSALQENVLHNGSMTGNVKGKKVSMNSPFQPRTLQPERLFKGPLHQGRSKPSLVTSHGPPRPLLDKTPFANRAGAPMVTPITHGPKIAKLPLSASHATLQTPGALLRPSSTRKHIRVPRSASKSFETPQSQGLHWDVSDISIEGPEIAVVNESIEEEDCDDIEYMPPSAVEPQYQPRFDMPDYGRVGSIIAKLTHSYHFDDEPLYDTGKDDILLEPDSNKLSLPKLEDDDPFRPLSWSSKPIPPKSKPSARTTQAGIGTKHTATPSTVSQTAARSARPLQPDTMSVSRAPKVAKSTATSVAGMRTASSSRPGTAISVPARRLSETAVTARPGSAFTKPAMNTRNRASTTISNRSRALGTIKAQKGIKSTITPRHPTSTVAQKSNATNAVFSRKGLSRSVASTPIVGGRSTGKATVPVGEEDLILKFDSMNQVTRDEGADDFKFDI